MQKTFAALLLTMLPVSGVAATSKKAHAPVVAAHSHKATITHKAVAARAGTHVVAAKGRKGRIPRTLRTIPVSPAVRERAVDRVEAELTSTASSPFLYPSALNRFFKALGAEQAEHAAGGTEPASQTVRILQFGDSHTAADIFTGAMRAHMQQQFGDGGLGFQFPGHPFAGYHLAGSLRSQSAGWFTEGNRFTALGDGDLGMGGISIETSQPEQSITLETTCTTLQLHFLQQPGGGRLQFSDNGAVISTVATGTDADAVSGASAGTFSYSCTAGTHDFEFTTLDHAPVKLMGLVSEQPGVTYECLGINGAVAPLMLRWNQALFANYLRQRDPQLIVLAYGTNEAGGSAEHLEGYPADFDRLLDNLHRIAPDASVLVLGPADRSMSGSAGRGRRAWHPFAGTERIIAMQKEACRTHGCTFWDTRRRMGGFGSMQQWVAAGWGQPDRTHLTGTGYRALADALYADLIHAYNLYQQHPEIPVQESSNGQTRRNP
ncbi:GDSL-type esterase/lipase family protein [Granulicella arctica]|uniref:GDSL-type esterase/lipase family protein n=1 Tax=Granulicella arctica TaxID=940613 RepID=UPI0021DFA928|nr:GDSL-type esterase/lipase family protein [Granulicella arctica]